MSKGWDKVFFGKFVPTNFLFMIGWVADSEMCTVETYGGSSISDKIQDVVTWSSWDSATTSK